MTRSNAWARHYQSIWHERAGDRTLPAWLRVACLAFGAHAANGHANFGAGQIGLVLGSVDQATGEIRPMDKHNVQRAITKAVQFGWLAESSGARCLVVPGHAITGGLGRADAACPQHRRRRGVSQKVTHLRPAGESDIDPQVSQILIPHESLTCGNAGVLYESSLPHPTDQPDREATA